MSFWTFLFYVEYRCIYTSNLTHCLNINGKRLKTFLHVRYRLHIHADVSWTMSGHVFLYILSYFLIFSFLCSFLSFLCVFFLFFSFLLSAFYVKHSHEDALLDKKLESEWEVKYMCELCQGAGKKQSSWGQSKLYETSILSQMINGVH